jgi:hypothetical protein
MFTKAVGVLNTINIFATGTELRRNGDYHHLKIVKPLGDPVQWISSITA